MKAKLTSKKPQAGRNHGKWVDLLSKMDGQNRYLVIDTNLDRIMCINAAKRLNFKFKTWKTDDGKICFEKL